VVVGEGVGGGVVVVVAAVVLLGAELNAEIERSREIEEGRPRAEREIQLEPRDEPEGPRSG